MSPQVTSIERLGPWPRIFLGVGAVALVAVLLVARRLDPDPRGFGTHTQLGLPPCAFQAATGRPCPTCGMTTSFARFARGQLADSWRANPAGSLLAPTCLALVPWLAAAAARGRPDPFRTWEAPLVGLAVAVVAVTVFFWTLRMTLGRALG